MEKKIYQLLSIISLIAAFVSAFFLDLRNQWILPLFLIGASFIFIVLFNNRQKAFLGIIFILPLAFGFNQYKFSFGFLSNIFGFPEIFINLSFALYLLLSFILIINLFFNRKEFKKPPLLFLIIIAISFFVATFFWSFYPSKTFPQIIILSTPFIVYWLAFNFIQKKEDIINLFLAVIFSSVFPIIFSIKELLIGNLFFEPDSSLGRITGGFSHPNPFGLYLFLVLAFILILIHSIKFKNNSHLKKILWAYFIFLLPFFILTYSRTAWVSLVIFTVLLFFDRKKIIQWIKAIPFLILLIAGVLLFQPSRERILDVFNRSSFDSISAREDIFKMGLVKFSERPILGYGIGNFEEIIMDKKESSEGSSLAHNDWIMFSVEGGIIGIIIYFSYTLGALIYLIKSQKLAKENSTSEILILKDKEILFFDKLGKGLLVFFLVTFFLTGISEAITLKTVLGLMFWAILGGYFSLTLKSLNTK